MPLIAQIILYGLLPLIGIGFIIIALICNKDLSDRKVINIKIKKIGLFLIADAFGLIVLIGIMMVGTGIYFVSQKYDTKINSYEDTIKELQSNVTLLSTIRLPISLVFSPENPANPYSAKSTIEVQKLSTDFPDADGEYKDHSAYTDESGPGGMRYIIYGLGTGDKLRIIVNDNDKQWKSNTLSIPDNRLIMTLQ